MKNTRKTVVLTLENHKRLEDIKRITGLSDFNSVVSEILDAMDTEAVCRKIVERRLKAIGGGAVAGVGQE